jgi:hypothetical protein
MGIVDNQFMLKDTFPSEDTAIDAALDTGRRTIDGQTGPAGDVEESSAQ